MNSKTAKKAEVTKVDPLEKMVKQVGRTMMSSQWDIKALKLFAKDQFKGLSDMHVYKIPVVQKKGELHFGLVLSWGRALKFDTYPAEWDQNRGFMNPRLSPEIFAAANRTYGVTLDSVKKAIVKTSKKYKVAKETVKATREFARLLKTNKPPLKMHLSLFDGVIQFDHGMLNEDAMQAVYDRKFNGQIFWPIDAIKALGITPADFRKAAQTELLTYLHGRTK